jgi:hypothetical protein
MSDTWHVRMRARIVGAAATAPKFSPPNGIGHVRTVVAAVTWNVAGLGPLGAGVCMVTHRSHARARQPHARTLSF